MAPKFKEGTDYQSVVQRFYNLMPTISRLGEAIGENEWSVVLDKMPRFSLRNASDWQTLGPPWNVLADSLTAYFYDENMVGVNVTKIGTKIKGMKPTDFDPLDMLLSLILVEEGVIASNKRTKVLTGIKRRRILSAATELLDGLLDGDEIKKINERSTKVKFHGARIVFTCSDLRTLTLGQTVDETFESLFSLPLIALSLLHIKDPTTPPDMATQDATIRTLLMGYPVLPPSVQKNGFIAARDFFHGSGKNLVASTYFNGLFLDYFLFDQDPPRFQKRFEHLCLNNTAQFFKSITR